MTPVFVKFTPLTNVFVPPSRALKTIGLHDQGRVAPVSVGEANIIDPVYPEKIIFELSLA